MEQNKNNNNYSGGHSIVQTSKWLKYDILHPLIYQGILEEKLANPTEVQSCVMASFKLYNDFVVASQTGSGKTLAFGVPILSQIIYDKRIQKNVNQDPSEQQNPEKQVPEDKNKEEIQAKNLQKKQKQYLRALIIAPTRELAMQIESHLKKVSKHCKEFVRIGVIVGGISKEKQKRILGYEPDILIATPGRLWEFINDEGHPYLQNLQLIEYLVIDEADRLVELGHFKELEGILEKIYQKGNVVHNKQIIKEILESQTSQRQNLSVDERLMQGEIIELDEDEFKKQNYNLKHKQEQQQQSQKVGKSLSKQMTGKNTHSQSKISKIEKNYQDQKKKLIQETLQLDNNQLGLNNDLRIEKQENTDQKIEEVEEESDYNEKDLEEDDQELEEEENELEEEECDLEGDLHDIDEDQENDMNQEGIDLAQDEEQIDEQEQQEVEQNEDEDEDEEQQQIKSKDELNYEDDDDDDDDDEADSNNDKDSNSESIDKEQMDQNDLKIMEQEEDDQSEINEVELDEEDFVMQQDDNEYQDMNAKGNTTQTKKQNDELLNAYGIDTEIKKRKKKMKVFLVSATLTKQFKGSKHKISKKELKENQKDEEKSQYAPKLQALIKRIKFTGKPKIIDLSSENLFPQNLKEYKTSCLEEDKPAYLYQYIKSRQDQNFIIFCNSISYCKKLSHILQVLDLNVVLLHSEMQQKQRLKKLDQFKFNKSNVLVCTDVAARGLDIPMVKNVVHYQIPRDIDTYIHRSGRTARIGREGSAYVMIGPKDQKQYLNLCRELHKEQGIDNVEINYKEKMRISELVENAVELEHKQHLLDKKVKENSWLKKNAIGADIELERDLVKEMQKVEQEVKSRKVVVRQEGQNFKNAKKKLVEISRQRRNAVYLDPGQIKDLNQRMKQMKQIRKDKEQVKVLVKQQRHLQDEQKNKSQFVVQGDNNNSSNSTSVKTINTNSKDQTNRKNEQNNINKSGNINNNNQNNEKQGKNQNEKGINKKRKAKKRSLFNQNDNQDFD